MNTVDEVIPEAHAWYLPVQYLNSHQIILVHGHAPSGTSIWKDSTHGIPSGLAKVPNKLQNMLSEY